MKNEKLRMKDDDAPKGEDKNPEPKSSPRPEQGADSQLHNYNVMLTRLGDLFGEDEEAAPPARDLTPPRAK